MFSVTNLSRLISWEMVAWRALLRGLAMTLADLVFCCLERAGARAHKGAVSLTSEKSLSGSGDQSAGLCDCSLLTVSRSFQPSTNPCGNL